MNLRSLITIASTLFAMTPLFSIDEVIRRPSATENFTEEEITELKEWIQQKRQKVGIKSLGGELTLSGEVHTDMSNTNEVVNGIKQRGSGGAVSSVGSRDYNIELDILMNYRASPTWATGKLKFKNKAGVTSGTKDKITLDRAFFGVRLVEGGSYTMDAEFGRRKLSYTFDSLIQFGSYMDGILFKYDHSIDKYGDFYFHGGPFVVDFKLDHYAYVFEIGALSIGGTGAYIKYSFIDWNTKDYGNVLEDDYYQFLNNQVILGYKIVPKRLNKVLTLYMAGLINSAARPLAITANKKANDAWYMGFSLGEVKKQGDWSFNCNYQYVMPQAVPSFDCTGIGRGNAADSGFYYNKVDGVKVATTRRTAVGCANYKGVNMNLLYLFTNNLTLSQSYQMSIRQDKAVGPIFRYKKYNLELVYLY